MCEFKKRKGLSEFTDEQKIEIFDKLFRRVDNYIIECEEAFSKDECIDIDEHYYFEDLINSIQPDFFNWYNRQFD